MLRDSVQGECVALLMRNEAGSIPAPAAMHGYPSGDGTELLTRES